MLENYYSCQFCKETFVSKEELIIEFGFLPVCSNRCVFRLYYKIIGSYSKEWISCLGEVVGIKDFDVLSQVSQVYEITKKYPKPQFSLLNTQAQGSGSQKQAQMNEHKIGSGSSNPYIIGIEPEPIAEPKSLSRWLK